MKLGIIGLPQSGKTTIYNALTGGDVPTTVSGKIEVHTAVVDVPDPRVTRLSELYKPKKTAFAKITFADIAGLDGSGQGEIAGRLRNELGLMDGFIHVARCFEDESVMHVSGGVDPLRDIQAMQSEILLVDLIAVEQKLEKLTSERKKGGSDKAEVERDFQLFERLQATLNEETPIRNITLTEEEQRRISGYQFLTMKPMLTVLNLSEGQAPPDVPEMEEKEIMALQGQLEMEISQLPPQEARIFLEEYNIQEPSLNRMIRKSYALMSLQSFFTVGEDEVRAWTVRQGAAAQEAAGVIHSDLQKGFIRAEVVSYQDLIDLGTMAAARDNGKLRVEGKTYTVQDGEIMHVRFNV